MDKATLFKFCTRIYYGEFLLMDYKLALKWAWPGWHDPISKFWNPLISRERREATFFKFGTDIECGQFLPTDHKMAP